MKFDELIARCETMVAASFDEASYLFVAFTQEITPVVVLDNTTLGHQVSQELSPIMGKPDLDATQEVWDHVCSETQNVLAMRVLLNHYKFDVSDDDARKAIFSKWGEAHRWVLLNTVP